MGQTQPLRSFCAACLAMLWACLRGLVSIPLPGGRESGYRLVLRAVLHVRDSIAKPLVLANTSEARGSHAQEYLAGLDAQRRDRLTRWLGVGRVGGGRGSEAINSREGRDSEGGGEVEPGGTRTGGVGQEKRGENQRHRCRGATRNGGRPTLPNSVASAGRAPRASERRPENGTCRRTTLPRNTLETWRAESAA